MSVWLEIFVILLLAWCKEIMVLATESIGTLIWFEVEEDDSMELAKVLVHIELMSLVENHFILNIARR